MIDVQDVWHWATSVPMPIWGIAVAQVVALGAAVGALVRSRRKAKTLAADERPAAEAANTETESKDGEDGPSESDLRTAKQLLVLALILCSVVLVAYVVGTYEGSTYFAADQLGWTNWRKAIPWATLDAAGFGFSLFWIRAVLLQRSPVAPRRVVIICAGFSGVLQMIQGGQGHKWQAGLFLAFLAVIAGLIVHTVVDQLRKLGVIKELEWRKYPSFGLRWITYFPNTFAAFLAFVNHPADGDAGKPTVKNALKNLDRVRAGKLAATAARLVERGRFSRWTMMAPWVRPRQISAVITSVESEAAARVETIKAEAASMIDTLRAEQTEQISKVLAEQAAVTQRADSLAAELNRLRELWPQYLAAAEQKAREQERTASEQAVAELTEQVERERRLRAEQERRLAERTESPKPRQTTPGQRKPAQQVSQLRSDDEIADDLFKTYREQMERGEGPLSRYRVETTGGCTMRQANRVLELLANRYGEHARDHANRPGEQADRTDDQESHRASPQLAGAR